MQNTALLTQQLARAEAQIADLRRELQEMQATRSWRLTRPLRFVYERFGDVRPSGPSASTQSSPESPPREPGAAYLLNDGAYWDSYVKQWESSPENAGLSLLGSEWKNEEIYLALLEKYAVPNGHAFEIGCGGGRITTKAVRLFGHVSAADVSQEMLRKCRESVHAANLSFQHLDGFTLENVPDNAVDVVYSHDVFVHFSSLQVYAYLDEIRRILIDGGMGIISFYNFFTSFTLFKEMSLQFRDQRIFPPHMRVHFMTEAMLRKMLEELNLEVIEVNSAAFLVVVFRRVAAREVAPT